MTVSNPTLTDIDADSPKTKDLAGQVAVVTGASRGVGQAIAIRLGSLGANVIVNYSRDAAGAARTVAAIQAVGSSAVSVQADVSLASGGFDTAAGGPLNRQWVGGFCESSTAAEQWPRRRTQW